MREDAERKAAETRRRIADIMKNPGDWEPVGPPVVTPALGKKYNVGNLDKKKQDFSLGRGFLTRLQHWILGSTLNDSEPVYVMYRYARSEFEELSFSSFMEALVRLFNRGYVEAKIEDIGDPQTGLTKEGLLKHYGGGLSERELNTYPDVVEYYFRATPKGEKEEAKNVYDVYYPD